MEKNEVKELLMSLRNSENTDVVTKLIGKIDMLSEEQVLAISKKYGDSKENIEAILKEKISRQLTSEKKTGEHYNINDMFYYGITGNCVHIHLIPKDLHLLKETRKSSRDT